MSRLGRIITALGAHSVNGSIVGGICSTAVDLLDSESAGLAILGTGPSSTLCATGQAAEVGEHLQFTLGEGPGHDAMIGELLVESDQLSHDSRWPMFAAGMAETKVASVASFAVRVGGARLGALTVYRDVPGRLSADHAQDGYVLARVAAHVILAAQIDVGDEGVISEIEEGFVRMEPVHQATGVIIGQLGVSAEEALSRLRSAAFAAGQPIIAFARDVIEGRTVLGDDE